MRRGIRRIICVLMSVALVLTVAPLSAFSKEEKTSAKSPVESSFSNNGLGGILNKLTEQESEENPDYQISFVEIEGKTATVNLNNKDACQLIVAIYDEITNQMLGSGVEQLEASSQTTSVDIDIDSMPEHFVCFAYLLDENYGSVCEKYECQRYSSAFDEFLEKEPEDFENKEILVFDDEKEQTDFAVLNDDVVTTSDSSMTYSYDEETLTYSFENITDEVRNLSSGDVFTYSYGDGASDFLVIKVKSISVSGNTATIVEDEITLADAFDFVRVDAEADFTDVEIDENELPEGLTLAEDEVHTNSFMPGDNQIKVDEANKLSQSFNISYSNKNPNGTVKFSLSGKLGVSLSVSAQLVYDVKLFGKDYNEIKCETSLSSEIKVTATGEIGLPSSWRMAHPSIPVGPLDLDVNFCPIFSVSLSGTFTAKYNTKIVISSDSNNGFNKTQNSSSDYDIDVQGSVTVKFGLSLEVKLVFLSKPHTPIELRKTAKAKEILSLSLKGSLYLTWSGKTDNITVFHDCHPCISGPVNLVFDFTVSVSKDFNLDGVRVGWNAIDWEYTWNITPDFFISISSDGVQCGVGPCPRKYNPLNFVVTDADTGKPIIGAEIKCEDCICDNNKDGKYEEKSILTNTDGKETIYLRKGSHSYTVSKEGYLDYSGFENILKNEKTIQIKLSKTSTIPPSIIDISPLPYNPLPSYYSNIKIGDTITMGNYDGKPIEWICASIDENGPLMLSKNVLCTKEYDAPGEDGFYHTDGWGYIRKQYGSNCWYDSNIRQWLNTRGTVNWTHCPPSYSNENGFISSFNSKELQLIKTVKRVINVNKWEPNREGYCDGGNGDNLYTLGTDSFNARDYFYQIVSDKMFLLDATQFNNIYLNNPSLLCADMDYYTSFVHVSSGACYEWVEIITANGGLSGYRACWQGGIRPAFYLNVKSMKSSNVEALNMPSVNDNALSVAGEELKNIFETSCIAGEKYIVLNVSGYQEKGFVLTSENLQYIGELTADENGGINEDILVKASVPNSVTILAGNFSDGSKVKYYCDHPCVLGNHNFTVTDYPASDSKTAYTSYECSVCGYYYEDIEESDSSYKLAPKDNSGILIDDENGFVLNVPQGTFDMDELLDYDGVELEYIETSNGFGTGTVMLVKSLDDGNILSSYTLVFNGDVTGDGFVDSFDVSVLSSVSNYEFEFDEYSAVERAADLNNDGFIDTFDLSILNAMANFEI